MDLEIGREQCVWWIWEVDIYHNSLPVYKGSLNGEQKIWHMKIIGP
jgi:hypothetical protein